MISKKKIFLASGSDLANERDAVELIIQRKNNELIEKELFFEIVRWEQMRQDFDVNRAQEHYSTEIEKCDVMLVLFFKRVGKYTKEEFDIAYKRFRDGKNPRHLYVYFKKYYVPADEIDDDILAIAKFKNEIIRDEQMFIRFEDLADLQLSVTQQIDLLVKEFEKEIGVIPVEIKDIKREAKNLPRLEKANPQIVEKKIVEGLARSCGLFDTWKINNHLRFQEGDIAYFAERKFTLLELEIQFRARKLVLEKADELGIHIDEPGDLSQKSKRIEALLRDEWQK